MESWVAGCRAADGRGAGTASVPLGALTLPEALDRQLGLKLQMSDRVLPVLIIDDMAREPVE